MDTTCCETCCETCGVTIEAGRQKCDSCWLDSLSRCRVCHEPINPWLLPVCDRCADEMAAEYQARDRAALEKGEIK